MGKRSKEVIFLNKNKRQKLLMWFKGCAVCRLSVPGRAWLCAGCQTRLKSFYLPSGEMMRQQDGLTHVRLLDWNKKNDQFLRRFLSSLKKGGPLFVFQDLMQEFLHRLVQTGLGGEGSKLSTVITPAPPAKEGTADHAFCLAKAFAELTGHALALRLKAQPLSSSKQKLKTVLERRKIDFSPAPLGLKNVIFMDDILTTGSTARAAYKALNNPPVFKIFTLAWRQNVEE